MRELLILLKTRFANTYNINKLCHIKKTKLILYAFLIVYVVVSMSMTFFMYAKGAADFLNDYKMISFLLTLFFIASSFTTFMFTIYNAKSGMFSASDNDLLLSMPIKASTILASRLVYVMLWNLGTSLFVMVPAFVVYAMNVEVTFIYYIFAFITFILLPVIPTILASIIGYIIAYLTSKSNAKNLFEIVMSFTFIGLIYYGMSKADVILNFMVNNIDNFENILKWGFYPVYLIGEIFNDYNVLSLLIYVVINIGLFIIFTFILSVNFKKIIAKLQENKTRSNFVMKSLKTESITRIFYMKELKRYLSSPIYVMNTFLGLIMIIGAAIATIFYDKTQILAILNINGGSNMFQLLSAAVVFIVFLSNTTSASISLEGKNYWVLKTLPLKPNKIYNGKLLLNLSLTLPIVYVSLIIFKYTLNLALSEFAILMILATIASLVSSKFGLIVNLMFPKMDAINDVVIVKRSLSVMICVLLPMAVIFGITGIYSLISNAISFNTFIIIAIVLLFLMNLVERILLNTWGTKRFKEIN